MTLLKMSRDYTHNDRHTCLAVEKNISNDSSQIHLVV